MKYIAPWYCTCFTVGFINKDGSSCTDEDSMARAMRHKAGQYLDKSALRHLEYDRLTIISKVSCKSFTPQTDEEELHDTIDV